MFTEHFEKIYGRKPTYGSLFTGVGGADVGLEDAGFEPLFQCEIDAQCQSVLRYRYPNVPLHSDVLTFDPSQFPKPDLLWCSPPCQAFSVSGARRGFDDPRGQLTLRTAQLVEEIDAEVTFVENVPGWLSDKDNAFGAFVGYVVGHDDAVPSPRTKPDGKPDSWPSAGVVAGPRRTVAYRIIDSQGFVPQRRRRVFVVAVRAGSRIDPVRMLFESEDEALRSAINSGWRNVFTFKDSVRRDLEEGHEARQEAAGDSGKGAPLHSGNVICINESGKGYWRESDVDGPLRVGGDPPDVVGVMAQEQITTDDVAGCLSGGAHPGGFNGQDAYQNQLVIERDVVVFPIQEPTHGHFRTEGASGCDDDGEPMYTLQANAPHAIAVEEKVYGLSNELTGYEDLAGSLVKDSPTGGGHPPMVAYTTGFDGGSRPAIDDELSGTLLSSDKANANCVAYSHETAPCLSASGAGMSRTGNERTEAEMLVVEGQKDAESYGFYTGISPNANDNGMPQKDLSPTLKTTMPNGDAVRPAIGGVVKEVWKRMIVRRLTPVECERLQDWDDDWTRYGVVDKKHKKGPNKGETYQEVIEIKDGPRYRMCGNGVSGCCSHWLGYRLLREFRFMWERDVDLAA